jgi:hypothetical protein
MLMEAAPRAELRRCLRFNFNTQVSPDRSSFNVVHVSPANPGNYLVGTAIHQ